MKKYKPEWNEKLYHWLVQFFIFIPNKCYGVLSVTNRSQTKSTVSDRITGSIRYSPVQFLLPVNEDVQRRPLKYRKFSWTELRVELQLTLIAVLFSSVSSITTVKVNRMVHPQGWPRRRTKRVTLKNGLYLSEIRMIPIIRQSMTFSILFFSRKGWPDAGKIIIHLVRWIAQGDMYARLGPIISFPFCFIFFLHGSSFFYFNASQRSRRLPSASFLVQLKSRFENRAVRMCRL